MTKRRTPPRNAEAGLTLIEVSVILSVLVILATFVIPSVTQFLDDANSLQARNDTQAIAAGLVSLLKDTGQSSSMTFGKRESAQAGPVDILSGPGEMPELNQGQLTSRPQGRLTTGMRFRLSTVESSLVGWEQGLRGSLEDYLLANGRGLPMKADGVSFGWNGPYLTSELQSDPWGNKYLVNVVFLIPNREGQDQMTRKAVFVVSAGPNGILETPFSQPVSDAFVFGDDIAVRIR